MNADLLTSPGDSLGARLQEARARTGITGTALAEALGVNVTSIKAWENDRRIPRANKLVNLAGVLGVSVKWLLDGRAEPVRPEPQPISIGQLRHEVERLRAQLSRAQTRLATISSMLSAPPTK